MTGASRPSRAGVLLDGYYGRRNAGDDAFCWVAVRLSAELWPGREVVLMADRTPALPAPVRTALGGGRAVRGARRLQAVTAVGRAERVVHVGGSTFRRVNTHGRDQDRAARLLGRERHAVGVSVGPFRSAADEREVARVLGGYASISVRDEPSYDRAVALGITTPTTRAADVAILLPALLEPVPGRSETETPVVAVSLAPFESLGEGAPSDEVVRRERLAALLRRAHDQVRFTVRLVSLNASAARGDGAELQRLGSMLDGIASEYVPYEDDPVATYRAVESADALVGMRLHASIFAFAAGVPFLTIDYHPKCAEFAAWAQAPAGAVLGPTIDDVEAASDALVQMLHGQQPPGRDRTVAATLARAAFDGCAV